MHGHRFRLYGHRDARHGAAHDAHVEDEATITWRESRASRASTRTAWNRSSRSSRRPARSKAAAAHGQDGAEDETKAAEIRPRVTGEDPAAVVVGGEQHDLFSSLPRSRLTIRCGRFKVCAWVNTLPHDPHGAENKVEMAFALRAY